MHDPLTVAFQISRPWPQRTNLPAVSDICVRWQIRLRHDHTSGCEDSPPHRAGAFPWWKPGSYSHFWRLAGRDFYWPPMVIVWHQEPGGHDSLSVCGRRPDGSRSPRRLWRWHVWHWRPTCPPLQELRRRLLTRCAWCGGRSSKKDLVNVSHSWDGPRGRWWHGERGLFHMDCSGIHSAHETCVCIEPAPEHTRFGGDGYGECRRCGRFRPFGQTEENRERARELQKITAGERKAA